MKRLFIFLVILLISANANSETIFVDATPGEDCSGNYNPATQDCDGSGSYDSYQTVNDAENQGGPDVIIEIRAGTYSECISVNHEGSSDSPFVLRAYNPGDGYEAVVIQAPNSCSSQNYALINSQAYGYMDYVEFYGLEVDGNSETGLDNCFFLKGTNNKIEDCDIHHCGPYLTSYDAAGGGDTCVEMVQASNTSFKNNEVSFCRWNGVSIESSDNSIVDGNYIHDTRNHACVNMFPQSQPNYTAGDYMEEDNVISNNILSDGTSCIYLQWQRRMQIFNNLVFDCLDSGLKFDSRTGGEATAPNDTRYGEAVGTEVYNNTFVDCGHDATQSPDDGLHNYSDTYVTYKNNIFAYNDDYGLDNDVTTGVVVANNLFYSNGVAATAGVNDSDPVTTDPGFNARASDDYSISNSGGAYNDGLDLTSEGVTTDILGVSRPQLSIFDIGAYEYEDAAPAPTVGISAGSGTISAGSGSMAGQ